MESFTEDSSLKNVQLHLAFPHAMQAALSKNLFIIQQTARRTVWPVIMWKPRLRRVESSKQEMKFS